MNRKIEKLVSWIKESKSVVILTGAGISTESGIPDFRSQGGLYETINPFHISTLKDDYESFHEFCLSTFLKYNDCHPNQAHQILAKWEDEGLVEAVITQNVDSLHQKGGSTNVIELHGTMVGARCMNCDSPAEIEDFIEKKVCSSCNGRLRPNIVLFGDPLPEDALNRAFTLCTKSDLVIVIGSSMEVMPACDLPFLTSGRKVLVNKDHISKEDRFDLRLHGSASDILGQVDNLV